MRFFVPLSNDPQHGEHLYKMLPDRLANTKEALADIRIYVADSQRSPECLVFAKQIPGQDANMQPIL